LAINPDESVKALDLENDDEKPELHELTRLIKGYEEKNRKLYEEIPEEIHVSCFVVNCKELLKVLSGKYKHLIRNLKDLIAKRCR
jgi:hypothetical protein